ncbi:TlpA disulfide reductase family protein [uncultured Flavobacterium sp.]|uniref:TlpA family protein disulfide reductase n=1 Tax=uncultured Flavobacterium sp. TaxID=165435 RepID=UPI0030ECE4AB|tara:strand:+ start:58290 stop:59285 length:996 start_codon:yes stop_codon:yes gene_type:complete
MKKLTYLLLLSTFVSFAQTEKKSTVKFTAKIENRNSDTLTIYGPNRFKQAIPINKKGMFEASIETADGIHQFSDGNESSLMYLKNGDDLSMTMNAKEFDETIVYKGKGAAENNFMVQKALKDEQFELTAFDKESDEFNIMFEAKKKADFESLEKGKLDDTFKTTIKKMMTQQFAGMQSMYKENEAMKKLNGNPSPTFTYENHKGGETSLGDFKGKYVYIDVWATWCAPCRAEIPFLQKIEEKYHGKNIVFVSVSIDAKKDYEKWRNFVKDKQLGGVQLIADNDWNSKFVKDFGINGIPRFILIGPDGNVVNANADRPSSENLDKVLSELVK